MPLKNKLDRAKYMADYKRTHIAKLKLDQAAYSKYLKKEAVSAVKRRTERKTNNPALHELWLEGERRRYKLTPNRWRNTHYKKRYGISIGEYETLSKKQLGMCAACSEPPEGKSRLVVDHDHQTGQIRGLLCSGCNLLIGHAKDQSIRAFKAAEYLVRHGC